MHAGKLTRFPTTGGTRLMSRLESVKLWLEVHSLQVGPFHNMSADMPRGIQTKKNHLTGTGEGFITLLGWQPFRFGICRFEFKSPKFLMLYREEKNVSIALESGSYYTKEQE